MITITAPEDYVKQPEQVCVFLAGGITNCPNWQNTVINQLQWVDDNLLVCNPRRENFPIGVRSESFKQVEWEYRWLERMDIFSMYFSGGESDQPICMYELGRNLLRIQTRFPFDWEKRIVITCEKGYRRRDDVYIQTGLATGNKVMVHDIDAEDSYMHGEYINLAYKSLSRCN